MTDHAKAREFADSTPPPDGYDDFDRDSLQAVATAFLDRVPVTAAAKRIAGQVVRTPLIRNRQLDHRVGAEVAIKAENLQHVGAFKARGAIHCVSRRNEADLRRGLVTYSSGNHGQAVALAAREHGISATVVMPESASAIKRNGVERLGAKVILAGKTSLDRQAVARTLAAERGLTIVPPFDHPDVIAGQGTVTLEILEEFGIPDALLVPVGGGGLIAGAVAALHEVEHDPSMTLYGVEPVGCDALHRSLDAGRRERIDPGPSLADGLRPSRLGALNMAVVERGRVSPLLVDDDALREATLFAARELKLILEPSGAATLAALASHGQQILGALGDLGRPPRIALIASGGNLEPSRLAEFNQETRATD